jgi:hypothetical protein
MKRSTCSSKVSDRGKEGSVGYWKPYEPSSPEAKLCYFLCSEKSHLPIRDVLNYHRAGNKLEPNYETATYNQCAKCNQSSIHSATRDGLSHILFATRYFGSNSDHRNRYFIVGYYEIGWTAAVEHKEKECTAIRAKSMCFTQIENAYEITDERWRRICPHGQPLGNLRNITQRIKGPLLDEILGHVEKHDVTDDYLREVARLKAEYNPFESREIPLGHIFIINVGANTSHKPQSPLFDDGRFEFVPIPEFDPPDSNEFLTFADLRQFYKSDQPLLKLFPQTPVTQKKAHDDPEFLTLTYGDNIRQKGNLRDLRPGDFLFFLARLVPYDGQHYDHSQAIFALVGYLEIAEWVDTPDDELLTSPAFARNAHARRWQADPSSLGNFAIFKGTARSRRFQYAVPFTQEFVEEIPILKADGGRWDWNRTTDLGVIGSYTRTARMHIDTETDAGREQAERFWRHVWESQDWNTKVLNSDSCGCA